MPRTNDEVKAFVEEQGIRFIRLWFTDILGRLKSFSINAAELDDAFEGGMGFDGSSITGFNAIEESDMVAMPDPSTFRVLPWRPEEQGVARMFCDVLTPERTPYEGDPRHVLRRALQRAESLGFDSGSLTSSSAPVRSRGGQFAAIASTAGWIFDRTASLIGAEPAFCAAACWPSGRPWCTRSARPPRASGCRPGSGRWPPVGRCWR